MEAKLPAGQQKTKGGQRPQSRMKPKTPRSQNQRGEGDRARAHRGAQDAEGCQEPKQASKEPKEARGHTEPKEAACPKEPKEA